MPLVIFFVVSASFAAGLGAGALYKYIKTRRNARMVGYNRLPSYDDTWGV